MAFGIILPKSHPVLEPHRDTPLFFLAGPVLGADDWQAGMIDLLRQLTGGDCFIATPCRYTPRHRHYVDRVPGNENFFSSQTLWEREYLQRAGDSWPQGCIVFWLPEESKKRPRKDGKPYACDTRGEIGEWRFRSSQSHRMRVVMGADPTFPGLSVIEKNNAALTDKLPILSNMPAVARRAVQLALN